MHDEKNEKDVNDAVEESLPNTDNNKGENTELEDTVEIESPPQAGDAQKLQQSLDEAIARAEENWSRFLRLQAEMDNLRKRTKRDVENAHKFALEKFATELLAVKDSLEMGLAASDAEAEVEKLREGTELTLKMFCDVMEKFGIQEVNPKGEAFNPELHQAMSMMSDNTVDPNTVINVMQKGYLLNERLIRPAMVIVSSSD